MLNAQAADYKQPEFTLALTITGVGVDVRLNDITIEFDMFSGHSTMNYDVNESVIAGVNELKVIAFPFFGKTQEEGQTKAYHGEAEVKATLYVNEQGDSNNKKLLSQIYFRPGLPLERAASETIPIEGVGEVVLDHKSQPLSFPVFAINQQIVATRKSLPVQSSYSRWAWQDGKFIEDTQENYDSLLSTYREIYEAYKIGDRKKLLTLHDHAADEFASAYYLKGGRNAGHAFMETGEMLDDADSDLTKFRTKTNNKLDIYADGKMARIINIAQYHPILFVDNTQGIVHTMKFGFYKNQQGEWIMIR